MRPRTGPVARVSSLASDSSGGCALDAFEAISLDPTPLAAQAGTWHVDHADASDIEEFRLCVVVPNAW